jgi:salicylate hydroxylase
MEQQPMRVAIIGGGIGGLAAAVALRRKGIEVTVHEQAPELGEVGAGVQIAPNGFRLLERFGLGQAVTDVAVRFQEGSSYYRQNGESISPSVLTDSTGWNALFGIHRADFLDLLAAALPAGVVHTGHRAAAFSQDADQATVTFENGDTVTADVVVGADGIHSVLRPHVVQPTTPSDSVMVA